jgi:glutamate-ammonia-ligase adenylyltransferase
MYIHRVTIHSHEGKVQDQLHLGWRRGGKIRSPEGRRELHLIVTLIKQFTNFIYHAPDPAKALRYFDQLMDRLSNDGSFNDIFPWLWEAESLKALATVLGSSDFLWEDLLRQQYATLLPVLQETIAQQPSPNQAELAEHLQQTLQRASTEAEQKDCLNAFKDRELFRIDMRHLLYPELPFGQFSEDLSDLAEVVMRAALNLVQQRLQPRYGLPFLADGQPCPFALCALGKFGGRELGYASDIELHCVYGGQGRTDGPEPIAVSEYAERLVRQLLDLIVARSSGIFELDLRLRPFGSKGPLAISEEAFRTYYHADGSAAPFERQALIKLRWVAGSEPLGRRIEAWRDQFVYSPAPFDLEASVALRQRQIDELVTPGTLDAKYSRGGLVDIEYTAQYLQLLHGAEQPLLRTPNTLCALEALHQTGYVQQTEYETLTAAYVFLRHLIDALRIVRGHARDLVLPAPDTEESTFLARRMGYWDGPEPTAQLFSEITHHMRATAQIYHDRFMLARSGDAHQ